MTHEQIETIDVSMSQKINLGNYETRDFFVSLKIAKKPEQTPSEVIEFGKEICGQAVGDYYRAIKTQLFSPKDVEGIITTNPEVGRLLGEIKSAPYLEALEETRKKVVALPEGKEKDLVTQTFNRKKISFTE